MARSKRGGRPRDALERAGRRRGGPGRAAAGRFHVVRRCTRRGDAGDLVGASAPAGCDAVGRWSRRRDAGRQSPRGDVWGHGVWGHGVCGGWGLQRSDWGGRAASARRERSAGRGRGAARRRGDAAAVRRRPCGGPHPGQVRRSGRRPAARATRPARDRATSPTSACSSDRGAFFATANRPPRSTSSPRCCPTIPGGGGCPTELGAIIDRQYLLAPIGLLEMSGRASWAAPWRPSCWLRRVTVQDQPLVADPARSLAPVSTMAVGRRVCAPAGRGAGKRPVSARRPVDPRGAHGERRAVRGPGR